MDLPSIWTQLAPLLLRYGIRVVGALVLWIVGRWAIRLIIRIARRSLITQHVDATLQRYLLSLGGFALNVLLVIAILSQFGVETTSFAALMAAAGLAIGTAWGGLLSNFAAGAFLLILRPFQVGDVITVFDGFLSQARTFEMRILQEQTLVQKHQQQGIILWLLNLVILVLSRFSLQYLYTVMVTSLLFQSLISLILLCIPLTWWLWSHQYQRHALHTYQR
jgi:hypothetical protein